MQKILKGSKTEANLMAAFAGELSLIHIYRMFEMAVSAMLILVACGAIGMFSLWGAFSL